MDGRNLGSGKKMKAFINPQMIFYDRSESSVSRPNCVTNNIHINPNFKGAVHRSDILRKHMSSRCEASSVHVNPNFLRPHLQNQIKVSSASVHFNPKLVFTTSFQAHSATSTVNSLTNFKETETPKDISVKNPHEAQAFISKTSHSVYTWKKDASSFGTTASTSADVNNTFINKSLSPQTKELLIHVTEIASEKKKTKVQADLTRKLIKGRNTPQTKNCYKYFGLRKIVKSNAPSSVKKLLPLYSSRTKLINKNSDKSIHKKKLYLNEQQKQRLLLNRKLQLLRSMPYVKSSAVKIASSVRTKYKYTNRVAKKSNDVRRHLKFGNVRNTKYKLDNRRNLFSLSKKKVNQMYKIQKLFPNNKPTASRANLYSWKISSAKGHHLWM